MKIAASLPAMPKIYIMDDSSMNAFATGRDPKNSAVAVTAGLLSRLNRDQLQGVIAHEVSHILNRDTLFLTFAGVMLGSITLIAESFLRGLRYSSYSSSRYRSRSRSDGQVIMVILAVVFAILAPILARIFYFALSRQREYLADASAVRLTRYPEGLASALECLAHAENKPLRTNSITAPMYIVNPLQSSSLAELFSTHPPIENRIKILRSMLTNASFSAYAQSFQRTTAATTTPLPPSAFKDEQNIPVRAPKATEPQASHREETREIGDLMRAVNNYAFLFCSCGLKVKVPPELHGETIDCPSCGRHLQLPALAQAAGEALAAANEEPARESLQKETYESLFYTQTPQVHENSERLGTILPSLNSQNRMEAVYKPQKKDWQSFSCSCGETLNVSPAFYGVPLSCPKCHKKILIKA